MLPAVQIDSSSSTPLYRQLFEQIAHAIRNRTLTHGYRLPPTRELAGQLGLNRTTVSAAYALLETDGLIEGHVGRGSFVNYRASSGQQNSQVESLISFASSRPAEDEFPMEEFRATCREVLEDPSASHILQLGSPFGYAPLREYLLAEARREGCAGRDDDVLITSGCQQALDFAQRVLAPSGAGVVIEDPVYHGLKNVFTRGDHPVSPVRVGRDGIDVEELEKLLKQTSPALVVLTPTFQNPTGTTMPIESRTAVANLSSRHGFILVENDIYSSLRYRGAALPAIRTLCPDQPGLILRSFSKIAFPGMRVGWIIAPRSIIARIAEARQWCDLHTDQLSQAIFLRFAESGRLASHLDRVRRSGAERLEAALDGCARYFPQGTETTLPSGGLSVWVRLPAGVDTSACLAAAQRQGVTYLPGRHFAVGAAENHSLRISFGALRPERIGEGLRRLGEVFAQELQRSPTIQFDGSAALV